MPTHKVFKNGFIYCNKAGDLKEQESCKYYILNEYTTRCKFAKFGMLCDHTKQTMKKIKV